MSELLAWCVGVVVGAAGLWLVHRRAGRRDFQVLDGHIRGGHGGLVGAGIDVSRDSVRQEVEWLHLGGHLRTTIARSPLVRVVDAGRASADAGVAVELLAIEIREAGCRCLLRFHTARSLEESRVITGLGPQEPKVHDDVGTAYTSSPGGRSVDGRGEGELDFLFSPSPPKSARVLTVSIRRFTCGFPLRLRGAPVSATESLDGFWTFEIDLS